VVLYFSVKKDWQKYWYRYTGSYIDYKKTRMKPQGIRVKSHMT